MDVRKSQIPAFAIAKEAHPPDIPAWTTLQWIV
jgi:hypothetical protein